MRTEDLFNYGVTPKDGVAKGKRLRVLRIEEGKIVVLDDDGKEHSMKHGEYELWQEPKTLFEDHTIKPTWGNLKKAFEAAGLDDDTMFVVPFSDCFLRGYGEPASFSVEILRQPYEKPKKHIVVK